MGAFCVRQHCILLCARGVWRQESVDLCFLAGLNWERGKRLWPTLCRQESLKAAGMAEPPLLFGSRLRWLRGALLPSSWRLYKNNRPRTLKQMLWNSRIWPGRLPRSVLFTRVTLRGRWRRAARLVSTERLYIVAVGIEYERGIVGWAVVFTNAWSPIVLTSSTQAGFVEFLDLLLSINLKA